MTTLTDALLEMARRKPEDGGVVYGVLFRGRRYDTGNKADYIRTLLDFALRRPDLADELLPWLRDFVSRHDTR